MATRVPCRVVGLGFGGFRVQARVEELSLSHLQVGS